MKQLDEQTFGSSLIGPLDSGSPIGPWMSDAWVISSGSVHHVLPGPTLRLKVRDFIAAAESGHVCSSVAESFKDLASDWLWMVWIRFG